jgi:hypothetical protein
MNTSTNQPFLFGSDKPKATRELFFLFLLLAATALRAADEPTATKVTSNSLPDVRAVMEAFCTQAPTNVALRPFASSLFSSVGKEPMTNRVGTTGIRIVICDCTTVSPCYEISATTVSPRTTLMQVRSMDTSPDEACSKFRPKRNARVMEELLRLLEKKT